VLTLFTNMLPKGGDLHHHYSGAIYAETYLDWVGEQNYCIYRTTDPQLKSEKFRIVSKPQELSEAARAVCINADAVRQDNAFYSELLKQWSDKDYDNHFHEQPAPDLQFFDTFGYFGAVSNYDYNRGLQSLKARAKAENLGYLETMLKGGPSIDKPELETLMSTLNAASSAQQVEKVLLNAYDFLASDTDTSAKLDTYVKSLQDAAAGVDDENFKVRFQAYVSRNNPPAKVFSSLYTSFKAAKDSKLVVGVNIVGPENRHVAMRDYSLHMKMFAFLKKRFPSVKLSLHAGELTLGMVPPEGLRSHIREAVFVAGANRIGHGVDIAHETDAPELLNILKQRMVAIEVNLTSNAFILGVKNEAHPVRLYARHGVPFVISTDDAGVSRNNLSGEYLLYVKNYKPSYDELKRVVYNSIRHSFLPDDEKREEMAKLDKRFAEFEARIALLPRADR
jgi:adenosine deaminase